MFDRDLRRAGPDALTEVLQRLKPGSAVKKRISGLRAELLASRRGGKAGGWHPRLADKFFQVGKPGDLGYDIGAYVPVPRLVYDLPLTLAERAVLDALLYFTVDGRARVSLAGIADKAHMERRNVPRNLRRLEARGLIRRVRRGTATTTPSVYDVYYPKKWTPELCDEAAERQARASAEVAEAKARNAERETARTRAADPEEAEEVEIDL